MPTTERTVRVKHLNIVESDGHLMGVPGPEGPQCDFCSSLEVRWRYLARDIEIKHSSKLPPRTDGSRDFSRGDWAACETCAKLIEKNQREKLLLRSLQIYMEHFPEFFGMDDALIATYKARATKEIGEQIHEAFWKARTGERIPVTH